MKDNSFEIGMSMLAALLLFLSGEYIYIITNGNVSELDFVNTGIRVAYENRLLIRIGFIGMSILSWLLFGYSEQLSSFHKKNKNYKWIALAVFLLSTGGIYYADILNRNQYIILYPILVLLYSTHGFILANLLKNKKEDEDEFKIHKTENINENEYSFNWYSEEDGYINIAEPFRGVYISGNPGSGKSFTMIKPLINQIVKKGYTGIIYDWKSPELLKELVNSFVHNANREPEKDEVSKYPMWLNKKTAGRLLENVIISNPNDIDDITKITNKIRGLFFYEWLNKVRNFDLEVLIEDYEERFKGANLKGKYYSILLNILLGVDPKISKARKIESKNSKHNQKQKAFEDKQKAIDEKLEKEKEEEERKKEEERKEKYRQKQSLPWNQVPGFKLPDYEEMLARENRKKEKKAKYEEKHKPEKKEENKPSVSSYKENRKIWIINFAQPHKSHRVNPIHPSYMEELADAKALAIALFKNLDSGGSKEGNADFFAKSGISYLQAIFWYLKNECPEKCNVPYAITIALQDSGKVIEMLRGNKDCKNILASILTASDKNAEGQLSGAIASLQLPAIDLFSPELFYVFSGNDFSLRLNDPENPGIMVVSNAMERKETYSPVASLVMTSAMNVMNKEGRRHSAISIDESPTLYIPNLSQYPATGRSNKLSIQISVQTKKQMDTKYGDKESGEILGTLGNQLFGQCGTEDDAKLLGAVVGKRDKTKVSTSSNKSKSGQSSKSEGESTSSQLYELIPTHEAMNLEQGRFVGKVVGVKEDESPIVSVRPKINPVKEYYDYKSFTKRTDNNIYEDKEFISLEEVKKIMRENMEFVKNDAEEMVDVGCRLSIYTGSMRDPLKTEKELFPEHFDSEGNRKYDIWGDVVEEEEVKKMRAL